MAGRLSWRETYALGHRELDADHRSLVQAINEICAACQAKREPDLLRRLLNDLERSAKEHFEREDRVLREIMARPSGRLAPAQEIGAAVLMKHGEEHQRSLARLQIIVRATQPSKRSAGNVLCEDLAAWFLEHAVKHDAHLKAVFQAM